MASAANGVAVDEIQERVRAVLDTRRTLQPVVDRELARWSRVQVLLSELAAAVDDARSATDGDPVTLGPDGDVGDLERVAVEAQAALAGVRARVGRATVNIGVSGRARNGKSTLLQALSGLGDDQIPAGRGQPVTAVRSRIFHSTTDPSAEITLHDESSFCAVVLAPYCRELGLPEPRSLARFEHLDVDAAVAALPDERRERLRAVTVRLREMRDSLPRYRALLTGAVLDVDVDGLRDWVAYPTVTEDGAVPERRHLAVRDAVIRCPFPRTEVADLGLVDLPGLGELVPGAEEHHVAGLENDVDFVLLVKRPTDTEAYWSQADQAGLDLIGRAAGAAGVRSFATILVNTGGCDPVNVAALTREVRRSLNDDVDDQHYRVWQADVADRAAVAEDVLGRALHQLAAELPQSDHAVIGDALGRCEQARHEVVARVDRLRAALRSLSRPTAFEELVGRADAVADELLVGVQRWLDDLRARTVDTYEDKDFFDRVERLGESVRDWAMDGFGVGRDEWIERAHLDMRRAGAAAKVSTDTLNGVRNELARRFSGIDEVLSERREEFWAGLVDALSPRLARLMVGSTAHDRLRSLATALADAPDPCPDLAEAVEVALDVRLDYRTRVLPRMRRLLDVLRPEGVDPATHEVRPAIVVPATADGAASLYAQVTDLTRQAIYQAKVLLEEETQRMALALLAYGEQFEDMLMRSGSTEAELRRLVAAYRDELWPEERRGPATATARVQRVARLVAGVTDELAEPARPGPLLTATATTTAAATTAAMRS